MDNNQKKYCSIEGFSAADLEIGQIGCISALARGRGFRARMLGLGLRPGARMKVVGGRSRGPVLIEVGRQKFMLGSEMLSGIFIEEGKQ